MSTVPGKERAHIHQFAFDQPREPLSWESAGGRQRPSLPPLMLWAGIFSLLFSQGLGRQEPSKCGPPGQRNGDAGACLQPHVTGAGAGLCVLRHTTLIPPTSRASQVERAAEKQEPGLIFKMQIKPFPSGLAGFSAVWLQTIDSQSR